MYFIWLTVITFISPDIKLLNIFSIGIVVFYFMFLQEKWDWFFFLLGSLAIVMSIIGQFKNWDLIMDYHKLQAIPLWFPMAWGTTAVALRKFYVIISNREVE